MVHCRDHSNGDFGYGRIVPYSKLSIFTYPEYRKFFNLKTSCHGNQADCGKQFKFAVLKLIA